MGHRSSQARPHPARYTRRCGLRPSPTTLICGRPAATQPCLTSHVQHPDLYYSVSTLTCMQSTLLCIQVNLHGQPPRSSPSPSAFLHTPPASSPSPLPPCMPMYQAVRSPWAIPIGPWPMPAWRLAGGGPRPPPGHSVGHAPWPPGHSAAAGGTHRSTRLACYQQKHHPTIKQSA